MSQRAKEEMLPRLRQRYLERGKAGKSRLIDEVCEQFGYSRKHAIKMLNAQAGWGGDPAVRKGRPPTYGPEVEVVLYEIWRAGEQPCGKRLKEMVPIWLPYYEREFGKLKRQAREKVLSISAPQIDRLLAPRKVQSGRRGRCGTKPGSLLKSQIPIRTTHWDVEQPGYLEADTVAHCGDSLEGDFIWSVTYTDICTGWTTLLAVWNKGAAGVVEATRAMEERVPFAVLGFDCDNGSEFLNWHLLRYWAERPMPVGFTRSRPYHKDDNGHVEQKNWTHVRQLLGYERLDDSTLREPINDLYRNAWELLNNYFCPSAKLVKKDRHGAKIKRRHDQPMTPCDRLLAHPGVSKKTKQELKRKRDSLNPFKLQRQVETHLEAIFARVRRSSRPTGSLRSAPESATPNA